MATIKSGSHKNAGQKSKNLSSGAVKKRKTGGIVKLKQIYRGKEMSLSGTFISCGKPASHEKIAAWITAHGGTFALEVTSSTTHLICSIEDFKKGTEQVKKALALGKENCHIVVFDWLEECLVRKNKLCRSERYWTLESTLKRLSKKGAEIDTLKKRFQNESKRDPHVDPVTDMRKEVNHVYYEPDGFEYKVALVKTRFGVDGRVVTEKYVLFLFQSTAKPHTYMFAAKYTSTRHNQASYFREWCTPKFFDDAFSDFKTFFRAKTGYEWDYRLQGIRIKKMFVYTPPEEGKGVGSVPVELGRVVREVVKEEESSEREEDEDGNGEDEDEEEDVDEKNRMGATITIHGSDSDMEEVEDNQQLEESDDKIRRGATITIHDSDSETDSNLEESGRSRNPRTTTSFSSCSTVLPYMVCDIGEEK